MSAAEFAHTEGFRSGLSAALAMAQQQAPAEPWLGKVALDKFCADVRERLAAGGCPPRWHEAETGEGIPS